MKCFIELWSAKESWLKMTKEERGNYLTQIGPALQDLMEKGVEIVCWSENDEDTTHRADYAFFAVWKFPSAEMKQEFEALVEGAGWYNYFIQENVSGESTTAEVIIGKMIEM
jgi:hypothetical protein